MARTHASRFRARTAAKSDANGPTSGISGRWSSGVLTFRFGYAVAQPTWPAAVGARVSAR
jgi:hypothetical protein